jgi:carboxyl-terminal processing protease
MRTFFWFSKLGKQIFFGAVKSLVWVILFLAIPLQNAAQDYDYCRQAHHMVNTIQNFHYDPHPLNNDLSMKIFDDFFEMLDPNGRVFTQEDIESLNNYRKKLDEEIKNQSCKFINQAIALYKQKLVGIDSIIDKSLKEPFKFTKDDYIEFSLYSENRSYAKDQAGLEKRWQLWLKYQMLVYLYSYNEDIDIDKISLAQLMENEPEVREKIRQKEKCRVEKTLNHPMGFEKYVASQWLKAIALSFDPHTDFFSSYDIRLFEASISKDAYSYGIQIEENKNGDIVISSIVPGSPAWNANELNKGDIILRLETADKQSHDFMCMDLFEAYESLQGTGAEEIRLIIKKNNGQVRSVSLKKEKMELEENVVQSFLLKGEKKIGYISLPGFYTQLEDDDAIGCANDVAKEIIKMKKDNIDGLILDLRFNGGGSMKEALELVGLFIDFGPVTVAMNKDNNPVVMRDSNRGTVYNGPLVVMVNGLSASASEIFAAALQDYNRAVIVGETTYGKATGQIILPIEGINAVPGSMSGEFVKVTVEKFFRLNGKTHQRVGVTPDIVLPDYYGLLPIREKFKSNALPVDSISKKTYFQAQNPLPLNKLIERSAARLSEHEDFQAIKSLNMEDRERLRFRLHPELFKQDFEQYNQWFKEFEENSDNPKKAFQVENVGFNKNHLELNPYKSEYINTLAGDIQSSIYVEEAFHIITDLVNLIK